jgi:hypothetical protein
MGRLPLEDGCREEIARLRRRADEVEAEEAPLFLQVVDRERLRRNQWIVALALRDAATRIEEAVVAIELARSRR